MTWRDRCGGDVAGKYCSGSSGLSSSLESGESEGALHDVAVDSEYSFASGKCKKG